MKIGFFTDSYFPQIDGVTYTIDLWRKELESQGHEVYVVYPDAEYEPDDREIPVSSVRNPLYSGYPIPLFKRPSTLPDLDIVHVHSPGTVGVIGRYYASKHDLPTVYTHHTPVEEYFEEAFNSRLLAESFARIYLPCENRLLESFDVVTASTEQIERDVEHIPLPVGIDMEFFQPTDERWYTDETVIGYSGRLSMEKNVREIVTVAERFDCEFVIVGEGPCEDRLREQAPENVTIRPFLPREELPVFYSSLDVFVTASTADTLGLSTLEANACGTPVVATDLPPFDRTIGPENGERFSEGDLEEMETAIRSCLDTARDTRSAVEPFAVDQTLDQLTQIYENTPRSREEVVNTVDISQRALEQD